MSINYYLKSNRINTQNSIEIQGNLKVYFTGPVVGVSNIMHESDINYKCGENVGFCDKNRLCSQNGLCIDYKNSANLVKDSESRYRLCNDNDDKNCISAYVCDVTDKCIGFFGK